MKLSELIEKITEEMSKGCDLTSGGVKVKSSYEDITKALIKAIDGNKILNIKDEYNYVDFIIKEEDFIDKSLLNDFYKNINGNLSFKEKQSTDYYMKRMCGIINVRVFRLVENDVF